MFGVDSTELLVVILVAVVVIGPKDLPRVMRAVGKWVGKARGMATQFKSGVNDMVRDSEIAELEQKWREQNDAIMRANPFAKPDGARPDSDWGLPPSPEPAPPPAGDAAPVSRIARPAPGAPTGAGNGSVTPARTMRPPAAPQPVAEPVPAERRAPPRAPVPVAPSRPAPRKAATP